METRQLTSSEKYEQFGPLPNHAKMLGFSGTGVMQSLRSMADNGTVRAVDRPSFYSPQSYELVAHYRDIAHLIKTGDGSWYRGVKPWSLAIRVGTQSMVSHGGTLGVERHRRDGEKVRNIDTCEGIGCRNRCFGDLIHAEHGQGRWKGQWYWGPITEEYRFQYNEDEAWRYARSFENAKYGHFAICAEAMWHMPGIRLLAFACWGKTIEQDWSDTAPYCSMLQAMIATKGLRDPVPGRASQLTAPQDTWQSLFWGPKIGLIP